MPYPCYCFGNFIVCVKLILFHVYRVNRYKVRDQQYPQYHSVDIDCGKTV